MGGGESKDRGKENGDVPAAPADTGRKLKSKSQKEQRVTMSQIHNKTLIEVSEDPAAVRVYLFSAYEGREGFRFCHSLLRQENELQGVK